MTISEVQDQQENLSESPETEKDTFLPEARRSQAIQIALTIKPNSLLAELIFNASVIEKYLEHGLRTENDLTSE